MAEEYYIYPTKCTHKKEEVTIKVWGYCDEHNGAPSYKCGACKDHADILIENGEMKKWQDMWDKKLKENKNGSSEKSSKG